MNELLKTFLGNIVNEGGIEEVKDEKVLDLKTKEGHDEAVESLNEVLKMVENNPIFEFLLNKDMINSLIGCVDKIYEDSAKEEKNEIKAKKSPKSTKKTETISKEKSKKSEDKPKKAETIEKTKSAPLPGYLSGEAYTIHYFLRIKYYLFSLVEQRAGILLLIQISKSPLQCA